MATGGGDDVGTAYRRMAGFAFSVSRQSHPFALSGGVDVFGNVGEIYI